MQWQPRYSFLSAILMLFTVRLGSSGRGRVLKYSTYALYARRTLASSPFSEQKRLMAFWCGVCVW